MKNFLTIILLLLASSAMARDPEGRYTQLDPKMHDWFMGLKSEKGPCCADADGNVVQDSDWKSSDGHYKVFIQDQWIDVPDEAVIKAPNLFGRTMVWPMYSSGYGTFKIDIRCFMPGALI